MVCPELNLVVSQRSSLFESIITRLCHHLPRYIPSITMAPSASTQTTSNSQDSYVSSMCQSPCLTYWLAPIILLFIWSTTSLSNTTASTCHARLTRYIHRPPMPILSYLSSLPSTPLNRSPKPWQAWSLEFRQSQASKRRVYRRHVFLMAQSSPWLAPMSSLNKDWVLWKDTTPKSQLSSAGLS